MVYLDCTNIDCEMPSIMCSSTIGKDKISRNALQLARSLYILTGRAGTMRWEGDAPLSKRETGRSLCVRFIFGSSSKKTGDSLKFMIYTCVMHQCTGCQRQISARQQSNNV